MRSFTYRGATAINCTQGCAHKNVTIVLWSSKNFPFPPVKLSTSVTNRACCPAFPKPPSYNSNTLSTQLLLLHLAVFFFLMCCCLHDMGLCTTYTDKEKQQIYLNNITFYGNKGASFIVLPFVRLEGLVYMR